MRIGSIFGRGARRALAWTAAVGVLVALGSAQAAAQPTVTKRTYAGEKVTITTSVATTLAGTATAAEQAGQFRLAGTGLPTGIAATSVSPIGTASQTFVVTFNNAISVTSGNVGLTYVKHTNGTWLSAATTNNVVAPFNDQTITADAAVTIKSITVAGASRLGVVNEGASTTVTVTLSKALPMGGRAEVNLALRETTGTQPLRNPGATGKAEGAGNNPDITLGSDGAVTNLTGTDTGTSNGLVRIAGGSSSGSVSLILNHDLDAVDEAFVIKGQLKAGSNRGVNISAVVKPEGFTIDDDEEQTYKYTITTAANARKEGSWIVGTVTPEPALPASEFLPTVFVRLPEGYQSTGGISTQDADDWQVGVSFDGGGNSNLYVGRPGGATNVTGGKALRITRPLGSAGNGDGNRTDDEITVEFLQGTVISNKVLMTQKITVLDIHKLPTVIMGEAKDLKTGGKTVTSVEEGKKVYVDVSYINKTGTDNISDTEKFKVEASVANAAQNVDVALVGGTFTNQTGGIAGAGKKTLTPRLELEAVKDNDVGPEKVTINLTVTGESAKGGGMEVGTFEIDIVDTTVKMIEPKAEDDLKAAVKAAIPTPFHPGMCFDLMTSDLFMPPAAGVTVSYAASSDSPAVTATASATTIKVCAVEDRMGMGKVTVTATANSSSATATQTVANVAQVSFDVSVVLRDLTVMLTADPMEIMEGGMSTITATANRNVTEDTMIEISVSGDADAYEVANMITIMSGMKTGSVDLTASQDADTMDEMLTVVASGPGIMGTQQVMITVKDDDDPVRTISAKENAAALIGSAVAKAAGNNPWMVGGMAATVDMSTLFNMDAGVNAAYSGMSSDGDVVRAMSSGSMLTLTPMGAGTATITVTGTDAASGDSAMATADVTVALQTLVVTVEADAGMVMEGASITLTATANRAVTADTTLQLTVIGHAMAVSVPDSVTIPSGGMTATAMLMAVEDDDAANASVTVVASGPGIMTPISIAVEVEDNDPTVQARSQAEVDALFVTATARAGGATGWLQGGDDAMIDMSELFMTIGSPAVTYMAESSNVDTIMASASGMNLTLKPMKQGMATIMVTATDTSGDAADTATVMSEVTVGVLPLEVSLMPAMVEVTEGGDGMMITATANKMVDANVEVMLMRDGASTAGMDDYMLEPSLITIMAGSNSGSLTVKAVDDHDVEGMEKLTLNGRVGDMDAGSVQVTIMDNDMEITYELSIGDKNIAEGMSAQVKATASSPVQMDTMIELMRDGSSTASGADFEAGPITIKAGETSGATLVMAVEDNQPDSGSGSPEVLTLYGMVDGMQTNTVSFYLWDAAVPALPVIAQLLLAALLGAGGYRRYRRR